MRKKYIDTFQSIYIDNLNGDKYRTGKTTPEGLPDPSAFSTPQNREGIQVGTALATLVRTAATRAAHIPGSVTGHDFSRADKAHKESRALAPEGSSAEPTIANQIHLRDLWGAGELAAIFTADNYVPTIHNESN
jgi:hypothetical protein